MVQKDYDGAEGFLRKLAGDLTGPVEAHLTLVQFLKVARGTDAARAELDGLIAANGSNANAQLYGAMRATFDFDAGKTTVAITAIQDIVKAAEPSDQTRRIKSMLARMQDATGNRVGARALVEEILAEDPNNVDALKLRGGWFTADDKPGDAIVDLRAALDQSPRDPEILTLMADAYERDGSLDLAGEQLARAVEVSGAAADESLRYAKFLLRQGSPHVAETVLANARQVSPANPAILSALAQFYIGQSEWPQAQEATDVLQNLDLPDNAKAGVQALKAAIMAGQNRVDDSVALLQNEVDTSDQATAAVAMIVRTKIKEGKLDEARTYLDGALAKTPDDKGLRLLSASLDAQMGKTDAAETTYRAMIAADPTSDIPVRQLYTQLIALGKVGPATAVLDAGLTALPKSPDLRWIKAGELERDGKIDDAIAVYEGLYAEDSSNTVVANNLASLITAHHDDDASLARAEAIARRLRELDVPAFQDTYGWIAFRRGNLDEALSHLEPAAKGLPNDVLTQFHLGMLYDKMGRSADAVRQFELVQTLTAKGDPSGIQQQLEITKQALDRLKATAPAP
ncbi:MAG: tetratricopeptide repeat protein, partial [Paracoccaceae bacterium]